MKYLKTYESKSQIGKYYSRWQENEIDSKYKVGDVIKVYQEFRVNPLDNIINEIMDIIFIRVYSGRIIYGVNYFDERNGTDWYCEVDDSHILRKLAPHEIEAIKYNL
jgi:hypothetical protein